MNMRQTQTLIVVYLQSAQKHMYMLCLKQYSDINRIQMVRGQNLWFNGFL